MTLLLTIRPKTGTTDSDNVNAVLHYDGAADAEPTTAIPALTGTNLVESNLVPATNVAAPGEPVAGGVDKVFNLAFTVGPCAYSALRMVH
jgi:iron transport multicopper oxidase